MEIQSMMLAHPPSKPSPLKKGEGFPPQQVLPSFKGGRFGWGVMLMAFLLLTSPARAEEKPATENPAPATENPPAENPGRFAPDFCDFEITFPEKPLMAQKCLPGAGCTDVYSYTMVYDLSTTVDVTVSCNPSTPANYKRYDESVMKAALAGMVERRGLATHDVKFTEMEKDKVKTASLTGAGTTGAEDKIYSGQLWVGQNSVFTIQAELVGAEQDAADKSFRDILSSIKVKEGKQAAKGKEPKAKGNQ
jgi:hypothetical protein